MKTLNNYIHEALISSKNKVKSYSYFPKNLDELAKVIEDKISENSKSIDVSDIDTSNIKDLTDLFFDCEGLMEIKGLEKWDVSNVEYFNSVFNGCKKLSDLSGVYNWDVSRGKTFQSMFRNCYEIEKLDLSKWNLKSCHNDGVNNIFKYCGIDEIIGIEQFLEIAKRDKAPDPLHRIAYGTSLYT